MDGPCSNKINFTTLLKKLDIGGLVLSRFFLHHHP